MTNEITRLAVLLAKAEIPFELVALDSSFGGEASVQIVSPSKENCVIDAICNKRSHGGKEGLLEVWCYDEEILPNQYIGNLDAENALQYFADSYYA